MQRFNVIKVCNAYGLFDSYSAFDVTEVRNAFTFLELCSAYGA